LNPRLTITDALDSNLTSLLHPLLRQVLPCDVLTLSSGGMYPRRFNFEQFEMDRENYNGAAA
jgi:hypothetical protein